MDIVSVTDETLNNALVAIQEFNNRVDTMVTKCGNQLENEFGNVDLTLKKELVSFIELLDKTREKLKLCVDENSVAIYERQQKLQVYENIGYNKVRY